MEIVNLDIWNFLDCVQGENKKEGEALVTLRRAQRAESVLYIWQS